MGRAGAYNDLNQPDRAIEDCDQGAIRLNPQLSGAYYHRGNAYRGVNQLRKAIEDYRKAIELDGTPRPGLQQPGRSLQRPWAGRGGYQGLQ